MKKRPLSILLLGLLLGLFSCEEPQLKLEPYTPRLVVISNFTTDGAIEVQVSKSRSPLDNSPTQYLTNAKVEILEGTAVLESLNLIDTRSVRAPYYISEIVRPRVGVDYTIRVSVPGFETVSATSRIPEQVKLDSVRIEDLETLADDPGFVRYTFNLIIYFTDPRAQRNFYHVNVFQKNVKVIQNGIDQEESLSKLIFGSAINSNYIVANYDGGFLIEDKPIDGRSVRIPIPINIRMSEKEKQIDEMIVELRSVSEEYYLFHSTVSRQQEGNDLPFSDPVVLFNNIRNGQGVFAGYNQAQQSVTIKR